jgi:hypothetical protein
MRRNLDARHEIARRDDRTVESGENLERIEAVEPFQFNGANVEHAIVRGYEIDPALDRTATLQAGTGNRSSEAESRLVLVEVARLHDDDRDRTDAWRRGRERFEVGAR